MKLFHVLLMLMKPMVCNILDLFSACIGQMHLSFVCIMSMYSKHTHTYSAAEQESKTLFSYF